jgi:rSAM/selenodomain-associated transferase 2/rSAM/selenodomain-associated transferase 1
MISLRIIVPVLNEAAALPAVLAALQPLRQRGAEVVVVDGGSTDATWMVASRGDADQVMLAPQGRAAQMNAGAMGAQAEALLFLHADTLLPSDADRLLTQALASGVQWGRFDVRIGSNSPLLRLVAVLMNLRSRWTGIATGDQAIFVRRQAFEAAGGFPDLPFMEDIAFSARMRRLGAPACLQATVTTSARRWEKHGVLRVVLLMWWLRLRFFFGASPQRLADRYGYRRRPAPARSGLAVMAKAPVAGLAKTRLAPQIGAPAAARLQRAFTLATLRVAVEAALGPVQLWCAPDAGHRFFRMLHARYGVAVSTQVQGGLGERMRAAAQSHFARHPELPLLVIGTDCPLLAPGHLQAAARALAASDAVLIPAEDGGYVLLGLARMLPQVFEGIAWSTPAVLAQTRERLRAAGANWQELDTLWDVDEPADLQRYQRLVRSAPVLAQEVCG